LFYLFDYSEILVPMDAYKLIFPEKNVADRHFIKSLINLLKPNDIYTYVVPHR